MANKLYNDIGMKQQNNMFAQLKTQFEEAKKSFVGDPRQEVQKLLNSGEMTQSQFNQLAQLANQIFPNIV